MDLKTLEIIKELIDSNCTIGELTDVHRESERTVKRRLADAKDLGVNIISKLDYMGDARVYVYQIVNIEQIKDRVSIMLRILHDATLVDVERFDSDHKRYG